MELPIFESFEQIVCICSAYLPNYFIHEKKSIIILFKFYKNVFLERLSNLLYDIFLNSLMSLNLHLNLLFIHKVKEGAD